MQGQGARRVRNALREQGSRTRSAVLHSAQQQATLDKLAPDRQASDKQAGSVRSVFVCTCAQGAHRVRTGCLGIDKAEPSASIRKAK